MNSATRRYLYLIPNGAPQGLQYSPMKGRPCLLWLGGAAAILAAAAHAAAEGTAWSSRVWQADGLPEKRVTGLAQTPDGFLWVATPNYLSRFDGVRFTPFPVADVAPGLRNSVRAAISSRAGGVWLVVYAGAVGHLVPGQKAVIVEGMPPHPETLTDDEEGGVWVTAYDGAVSHVRGAAAQTFGAASGLGPTRAAVATDTTGRLWFTQGRNLGLFRDGRFETSALLPHSSSRLLRAQGGGIWISSGPRLLKHDGTTLRELAVLPPEFQSARASALLETRDGAVWIGTRHDGVFRYAGGSDFETIPTSDATIVSLLEDREGNVWIGTGGGGLNRVQPRPVEVEGAATGFSSRLVQSITEDAHGTLWGVTRNGRLVRRGAQGWEPGPIPSDRVGDATCVAVDAQGGLWIGTRNTRLHRWRDGTLRTWRLADGLEAHTACALLVTRSGDVWLGGEGPDRLQRVHGDTLATVALPGAPRMIRALAEDDGGDVWIGANDGALFRVRRGSSAAERVTEANKPGQIRSLYAEDGLWIGYEEGGLGRLKEGRFTSWRPDETAMTVAHVVGDPRGTLWLGTDRGILRIGRRALAAAMDHGAPAPAAVRVGADEPAFSVPANGCGFTRAVFDGGGRLWMPMGTAVTVVHPDRLPEDPAAPRVMLSRIAVEGRTRGLDAGLAPVPPAAMDLRQPGVLRLEPGARRVEIEFTSPTYRAPENVRFRHRLHGLDDAWTEAGTQRSVSYAHLPAGTYRFQVVACSGEGTCSEPEAAVDITVAQHVWQTWWFRLAALGLFASAVAAGARHVSFRRLRSDLRALQWREQLHKERARIARDIHDDIGNRLTTITLLTGLAQRDIGNAGAAGEHVRQISATARQVTDSLDEIVWAVNPGNDTAPHVVGYIGQFAVDLARTAGLRIRTELPEHAPPHAVSAEARHSLFLAVKEAVNNVVRHAGAREIVLRVTVNERWLEVDVGDDGCGFDAAGGNGNGLPNMRQRMADVGGRFDLASEAGRGTRISFAVPLVPRDGG